MGAQYKQNNPPCPFDRKPCSTPGKGCQSVLDLDDGFGEDVLWECPRFPYGKKLRGRS